MALQRDCLFSLLGLATDGYNPLFQPDYDIPFEDIVLRYAKAFVKEGWGIDLLYRAGLADSGLSDTRETPRRFPSWIPDWTRERLNRRPLALATGRGVTFSASGKNFSNITYDENLKELVVAGAVCDSIVSVSQSSNLPAQRSRYFQELDLMIESLDSTSDDQRMQKRKETVPIAGALYSEDISSTTLSITESYLAFRKTLRKDDMRAKGLRRSGKKKKAKKSPNSRQTGASIPNTSLEGTSDREKSKTYAALLDADIQGWKFVLTEGGLCGIAPGHTLPGDKVAVIYEGKSLLLEQQFDRRAEDVLLAPETGEDVEIVALVYRDEDDESAGGQDGEGNRAEDAAPRLYTSTRNGFGLARSFGSVVGFV
ncbi:hypothetical protein N0V82_009501 [Gnomoniopsis sp. IMI 355080]|nr:hypothetical protein N0V82_009501 [Gnomoniopsis sp. IMI 355080]